jgi:hypothetical protein
MISRHKVILRKHYALFHAEKPPLQVPQCRGQAHPLLRRCVHRLMITTLD